MRRRTTYAIAGGVLGLGAPAGLLALRLARRGFSEDAMRNIRADAETFGYVTVSTITAFGLFGGVLGHHADQLAKLATTDPLTGLFNARALHDSLRRELGRAARYHEPLSFMFIDVDGLKRINDRRGHDEGDAALRAVASAMRRSLRDVDTSARIGGDEFAVVAPQSDTASAIAIADRLRALIEAEGGGRKTTISVGVASWVPSEGRRRRPETLPLMVAADQALYTAKHAGGNRVASQQVELSPDVRQEDKNRARTPRAEVFARGERR